MVTDIEYLQDYPEDNSKHLGDYLALLKRNKSSILITGLGTFFVVVAIVTAWPPTYRSSATILIEEQEIPGDLVRSTITTFAVKRLQIISQRVMTRANLLKIIDRYGLYKDKIGRETPEEIVERMRQDANLNTITAEVVDPRTGRPTTATIAFNLTFDSRFPEIAQKVTDELASLYLNENLNNRKQKAAEASEFLTVETNRLSNKIAKLESKLADFKEQHSEALPEFKEHNFQLIQRLERDILETQNILRSLEDKKFYLQGQLMQLKPGAPLYSSTGERILGPADRLMSLQTEYDQLSSRYHFDHPDLIKMRKELASLKESTGNSKGTSTSEQLKELERLRTELAANSNRYRPNHPEIVKLKKNIESLEEGIKHSKFNSFNREFYEKSPENPAYIAIKAQLDGVKNDIKAYKQQILQFRQKLEETEKRLSQSPQVEREYLTLARNHENALHKYQEIKAKQMEAAISQELERDNKAERFSLVETPSLPENPIKPNRPALIVLGILLSIGIGIGQAMLRELSTGSVYNDREVFLLLGAMPLTSIPYYQNEAEISQRKRYKIIAFVSGIAACIAGLILTHFLFSPLDVLWYRIIRKLDILFF